MKVSLTILALVTTMELVLGVPVYGPPQPLPIPQKYRSPNGAPIPAKYPPHLSSHSGKNEFYSKFNPHSLPPGLRGPAPQLPPPFAKYPNLPPPGKHQQQYQQQNQYQHQHQLQHQPQQHQPQQHQPQQYQVHQHPQQQQQQQQQQHQQQPHHSPASSRPIGPQFQSKPHLLQNSAPHHPPQQGQVNNAADQRVQLAPSRPTPKITNVWTGPKLSGSPDFPPRFPTAATNIAPVTAVPFLEKPRGPYIINSDDERGPIKTIPAPNLNPADKPANFEEQLYRAQHQQSYVQPLDNSITDEKVSYQVTEDPNVYKQIGSQPSPTLESNPVPAVPLDIALQQHLDNQHQQQLSAEQVGSTGTLTPQELYSLLNGSPAGPAAAAVVPQTTYMVQQPVVYAVPQPQSLDLQAGHQLQYQPQPVQLQYAVQQPAATGVQLQYAQPAAADLQYLQPQTVQYHPQAVQYQPQTVQYQVQPEQQQQQQQQYQQQSAEQYNGAQKTATAAELSAQKQQQQQELIQQQQEQEQERQEHEQQQQRDQLNQQQQQAEQQLQQQQQQQQQQQPENDVQYQQEQDEYEPRNKGSVADEEHDQKKLQSLRDQYYSAVPNEQTAGVLAQIAQSAANNDEPSQADEPKAADKSPSDHQSAVQMHTSVQIQQSVPLYEATYASSRRTNQEYVDESPEADELMEGSESVAVSSESSPSSSVNGHAPNQFPYSAANINAFAAN